MLDERRELEIRERLEKGGMSEAEELSLREELDGGNKQDGPGIIDTLAGNVKKSLSAVVDPQNYKYIAKELSNFPPVDKSKFGSKEEIQAATDIALSALPVTQVGKAARALVTGRSASPVEKLVSEGVAPSLGQKLGGAAKRAEEALTSIPLVGDVIKGSQTRGIESFNRAALNRVLKPIGTELPKNIEVGHRAVDFAHSTVSKSYDDILPKLSGKLDNELLTGINSVDDIASQLPEAQAKQLSAIIKNNVLNKFDSSGNISGNALKDSLSRVGKLIRQYGKSENPDHQLISEALGIVKDSMTGMLQRLNPKHADTLKGVDEAYANLVRVERAAASLGAKNGVFTPNQLASAVKASDASLRKTGYARGNALLQDLAESGQNVLSQTLPDSGTASRLLAPYLVAGGAGYAGSQNILSPEIAGPIALAAAAFTRPGQATLSGIGNVLRNQAVQRSALGYVANDDLRNLRSLLRLNAE